MVVLVIGISDVLVRRSGSFSYMVSDVVVKCE